MKFSKLAGLILTLSLTACSVLPEKIDETKSWSDQKLYAEARDELSIGNFDRAIQYFEKLEARQPFGVFAQQAQMEVAYAYYRQNDQAQALAATERFIKLHPNHAKVDYMYYLRGLINFNDKTGLFSFIYAQDPTERDPKAAREAFDSFKQLVDRFPNSIYTPDAIDRMKYLVNAMAQYEVHVAQYYLRRGAYIAAINRAQIAVNDYRAAPAIEEALLIMLQAYDKLGMKDLRDDTERVFRQNFPNSSLLGNKGKDGGPWWKIW